MSICRCRSAAGMTQVELARRVGVSQGAVWQWEKGLTRPSVARLLSLSRVLGCTVDELLCEEDGDEKQGG